ncbi:MAG: preprotein translocase subunit SecA [Deltaproteobacteria bacterium]|nr:preprotein translocase subunit SecA [Deltaproteobacteria bacterium]
MDIGNFLKKIFGSRNDRYLRSLRPLVARINELEPQIRDKPDDWFRPRVDGFREEVSRGRPLDDILPEMFAMTREAGRRRLGMRHFDVQLIGGIALHHGKIAEMKTGEGKTLVATLAASLNAVAGKGVHVVTVNDYLARRDRAWMDAIYSMLGLSTGVIVHGLTDEERQREYAADITYGQNNEFGFDYLRDHMKFRKQDLVQRGHSFAIVDEVDSILIDEARTPLIISGQAEASSDKYTRIDATIGKLVKEEERRGSSEMKEALARRRQEALERLKQARAEAAGEDYEPPPLPEGVHEQKGLVRGRYFNLDEKGRNSSLADEGVEFVERDLGVSNLFDLQHVEWVHHVNQSLKAHLLFNRDVDYVVNEGEIIIVDEFTGRLMPGRRWSDGLHQAIEAKEGAKIENENQTLATITFQNYFRLYGKLSGMTGTAETEAGEFLDIYKLEVIQIPTNLPMVRDDRADLVFKDGAQKLTAVVDEILEMNKQGRPVLVGTTSIEKSEQLAGILRKRGIAHEVLNAKQHAREADIVAQAGRLGAITISTNMAGRGTDIVLGGNPEALARSRMPAGAPDEGPEWEAVLAEARRECEEQKKKVKELGGLHIVGTERHESRRIDNQLRGRAGRQGDPGSSQFFLSLDDDLLRIFGGERIRGWMERLGMEDGEAIQHPWLSKSIANAQQKVEARNYDIRKHLLKYDDALNRQRLVIYSQRREILQSDNVNERFREMVQETIEELAAAHCPENSYAQDWDFDAINQAMKDIFEMSTPFTHEQVGDLSVDEFIEQLQATVAAHYAAQEAEIGPERMRAVERHFWLITLDSLWKEQLINMDHLKEGVGLRGYGQQDPVMVYKQEAFNMFSALLAGIQSETVTNVFRWAAQQVELVRKAKELSVPAAEMQQRMAQGAAPEDLEKDLDARAAQVRRLQFVHQSAPTSGAGGESGRPAARKAAIRQVRQQRIEQAGGSVVPQKREAPKIGRNDPCWCGSGKKYKNCHWDEDRRRGLDKSA